MRTLVDNKSFEMELMKIGDLKPGMSRVDINAKAVEIPKPEEITAGRNVKRNILELKVEDETGLMTLILWDDKIIQDIKVGDTLQIRNGFVTSFRGEWRINVGKYGEITKI